MRIEDREDYIDYVAQAVIDRLEERDRIAGMVDLIARRVIELQEQKAALAAAPDNQLSGDQEEETHHAGERNGAAGRVGAA